MKAGRAAALADCLSERDIAVLSDLERFRLLTTGQIQRLHFSGHVSDLAAARACSRSLVGLRELGVVSSLERRIGGVRRGSASYVWQLAAAGERFLRSRRHQAHRRRFVEPSPYFVAHTVAVADVAVSLLTAQRGDAKFGVQQLGTEPGNWRRYLGPAGEIHWLKPDLHLIASHDDDGGYEAHAFLEIDLGTEHLPRIQAKCRMYAAYLATGAYQAAHGLVPAVVWLSRDPARRAALEAATAAAAGLPAEVFQVADPAAYVRHLAAGAGQLGLAARPP